MWLTTCWLFFFYKERPYVYVTFGRKCILLGDSFFPQEVFPKRFSRDSLHMQILIFVAVFQKNTDREVGQEREARLLGGSCHKS